MRRADEKPVGCHPSAFELYVPEEGMDAADLVDDMVRVWWESSGMPLVLTDRTTAR